LLCRDSALERCESATAGIAMINQTPVMEGDGSQCPAIASRGRST